MSVAPSSTFKGSAQLLMVNGIWAINLAGTQHDKTNCLLSATLGLDLRQCADGVNGENGAKTVFAPTAQQRKPEGL